MFTKVFISWSGDQSRELAEALRNWLPAVIQSIKPFFTPDDIEKGARWQKDISEELQTSNVGIFCLTRENLTKPWLMFEAGALSKNIDASKVCPILFGLESSDIEGPLVQFQAAPFSQAEIRKVLNAINQTLGEQKLEARILDDAFETYWPKLKRLVDEIAKKYEQTSGHESLRDERAILEEILQLSRLAAQERRVGVSMENNELRSKVYELANRLVYAWEVFDQAGHQLINKENLAQLAKPLSRLVNQFPVDSRDTAKMVASVESIASQTQILSRMHAVAPHPVPAPAPEPAPYPAPAPAPKAK